MSDRFLADRAALHDLMLKYVAGLDERRFDLYGSCFADDVEVLGFAPEPLRGRDALLNFVKVALSSFGTTQHLIGSPLVSISRPSAHGRTSLQGLHYLNEPEGSVLILWGTYETDFEQIGDEWKIKKHELLVKGTKTI